MGEENVSLVWIYLKIVNILAIVLTIYDKQAARTGRRRVKERVLMLAAISGGAVAMGVTMFLIRHKTRKTKFVAGIPVIVAFQLFFLVFGLNQSLAVSYFTLESDKIDGRIGLMLVTDLHSCDYGAGQEELLNIIYAENPDLILLAGDIFDDELPPDNTIEFLQGIAGKYPSYFVSGNHEFWSGKIDELKDILTANNVKVLAGTTEIAEIRGNVISISGLDDPVTDCYNNNSPSYLDQLGNLGKTVDHDKFTLLMSHRPERVEEFLPLGFDLIVAGHAHGGQWRLPFILENGLLAPNQGLFPQYTNGAYSLGETVLIVSRGLARESTAIPRLFNRPELVMISLQAESGLEVISD